MSIYVGTQQIGIEYVDSYQLGNVYLGANPIQAYFPVATPIPSQSALIFNVDANSLASYPGSGSIWYNTATNGASTNLLFTGSVTYTPANSGFAPYFLFDTASYWSTSNISSTVTDRTQCVWIYVQNTDDTTWLGYGKGQAGADVSVSKIRTSSNFGIYAPSNFLPHASASISSGQWINLIGITSGTTGSLYINGTLAKTETGITTATRTDRAVISDGNITGRISMLSIYNIALDAATVAAYYNNTKAIFGY